MSVAEQYLVFKVGSGNYALNVGDILGIETVDGINTAARVGNVIPGIVVLRGETIPIYSLKTKFGGTEEPFKPGTNILITRLKNGKIGFRVDAVNDIISPGNGDKGMPEVARNGSTAYAKGIINSAGRLIIVIDQDALVSDEIDAVNKIVSEAAKKKAAEEKKAAEDKKAAEEKAKAEQ